MSAQKQSVCSLEITPVSPLNVEPPAAKVPCVDEGTRQCCAAS